MRDTRPLLLDTDFPAIRRRGVECLQVNLGYRCNQSCSHCHVNAGPNRTEQMGEDNIELILEVLRQRRPATLDLTGGAPEMHPQFRYLVSRATALGVEVIDRCNLTILMTSGYEDLASFLAEKRVTIVASLPCYTRKNVDQQRGKGVFEQSIEGLRLLNQLGYGRDATLPLNLVYNPGGAFLPPPQEQLKRDYQAHLQEDFGICFNQLYTITNMPISRFGATLLARGEYEAYLQLLKNSFQDANLDALMCRDTVSVDWRGQLYDCDFNQMLELPMAAGDGQLIASDRRRHLRDLLTDDLTDQAIAVGDHCYGCTAGQGSSCGGALA
ncbi:MAG: radical SAM/Cys-rich domain protein [Gammaproteobacteria bacterium]|nr:MAG: radical SAM/Cys-rich domain protein [Gammaproteobacteria bacterium]